jgi:hypothetical protein
MQACWAWRDLATTRKLSAAGAQCAARPAAAVALAARPRSLRPQPAAGAWLQATQNQRRRRRRYKLTKGSAGKAACGASSTHAAQRGKCHTARHCTTVVSASRVEGRQASAARVPQCQCAARLAPRPARPPPYPARTARYPAPATQSRPRAVQCATPRATSRTTCALASAHACLDFIKQRSRRYNSGG